MSLFAVVLYKVFVPENLSLYIIIKVMCLHIQCKDVSSLIGSNNQLVFLSFLYFLSVP